MENFYRFLLRIVNSTNFSKQNRGLLADINTIPAEGRAAEDKTAEDKTGVLFSSWIYLRYTDGNTHPIIDSNGVSQMPIFTIIIPVSIKWIVTDETFL